MNVVSLLPSATEILYALGVEPVGVSHECDHPPAAADLPTVVRSRVDADADSAEVDRQVQEAVADGDGVYEIDVAALDAADPDLVVTQGICDVCAVDELLVERAIERIDADPEVLTTDPHHLADVFEDIERVGAAVGREDRAAEVVADLRERVAAIEERVPDRPPAERPRVAVLDWLDPVMVAGHWVPGMVERAGGAYGMADPGDRSTPREWAAVREYDPEVLVAAPCGFGVERTAEDLPALVEKPGWEGLAAVRDGRTYVVDGHHLVNRPGPRLVESLETLAACLHPDRVEDPPTEFARPLADLLAEPTGP